MTFPMFSEPWPEPVLTGSWRALHNAVRAGRVDVTTDVLPVRISRGAPKFWPEAASFPALAELTPDGWMFGIKDDEKFNRAFRRRLHTIGFERIEQALDDLLIAYCRPLVLCCFEAAENGLAPRNCHRGPEGFAGWYRSQGGAPVPEWTSSPLDSDQRQEAHNREGQHAVSRRAAELG